MEPLPPIPTLSYPSCPFLPSPIFSAHSCPFLSSSSLKVLLFLSHSRFSFASASPDNIKQWKLPDGNFIQNLSGHQALVNALALNADNVLVSGGESLFTSMCVWKEIFLYRVGEQQPRVSLKIACLVRIEFYEVDNSFNREEKPNSALQEAHLCDCNNVLNSDISTMKFEVYQPSSPLDETLRMNSHETSFF